MSKAIPTKAEILNCAPTVPVVLAAAYLGMCPQSVREGMKDGSLKIGEIVKSHFYIYPVKLVACKEGVERAEAISSELKTVRYLMETGLIDLEGILGLIKGAAI